MPTNTGRQDIRHRAGDFTVWIPVGCVLSERPVQQRGGDTPSQRGNARCIIGLGAVAECRHQVGTWIAIELFDRRRLVESRFEG